MNSSRFRSASAGACAGRFALTLAGLLAILAMPAQAGSPRVTGCYPSGGQRGTEREIVFQGSSLADAREVLFDDPGFEVSSVKAAANTYTAKVKIAPEARLGEHSFRVITNSGISDLRLFYVTPFPMVEREKNKAGAEAEWPQAIALNTTVYGHTPRDVQHPYLVEAKKGQRLTVEVVGCKLQSQNIYDPQVSITNEAGKLLKNVDDAVFGRQDPVFSLLIPEDGRYTVTIRESTNAGIGECQYLMHIGTFAQPLAVYPSGGPAGEALQVQLLGDDGTPVGAEVKLPAGSSDHYDFYSAEEGMPAPMPNCLRVSNFANVLEAEPNNTPREATDAGSSLPIALNGVISEKGDIDYFKVTAKKGQVYDLDVYARQLRSPLDSVLSIHNPDGGKLAENDDNGMPDSHLRWTAPADGPFLIAVTDQLKRGGPLYTYRVEIKPVEQKVTVSLPEVVINSSQERRAIAVPKGNRYASLLRVKRQDIGGEVRMVPEGLPTGVRWSSPAVDKNVDTVPVVFEAEPDAEPKAAAFGVLAKVIEPGQEEVKLTGQVEHVVDIIENGNQKALYSVREEKLPIAVTNPVPVKLTLEQPKVPILQNGSLDLKVKVERVGDYKGPVALTLLYNPPGIGSAGPGQAKEGAEAGIVTISCSDKAAAQTWKICVVGSADFGKGTVWFSSQLVDLQVAPPFLAGQLQRTFIDQGDQGSMTVKLEQKVDFEGKARIALMGLPPGITASEREVTKDDKEVKFDLKAEPGALVGQHRSLFCQFKLVREGEPMITTFAPGGVLRVDKASVAKNEPKK